MSHVFFPASPNAFHVTINPADRFNNVYADYMPSLDMRLGTFIAQTVDGGYHVDVSALLEFPDESTPPTLLKRNENNDRSHMAGVALEGGFDRITA